MTPEQQRIEIAEVCGYINVRMWGGSCIASMGMNAEGKYWGGLSVPDYLNDLNAMHEAEGILTNEQIEVYCSFLQKPQWGIWWGIHATAAQRAEAFLRTINKWTTKQQTEP